MRSLLLSSASIIGRASAALIGAVLATALFACPVSARAEDEDKTTVLARICTLIETHAEKNGLPPAFFARLIWKESRFDVNAVSHRGAQGIAQFMPGTAAQRGLEDAFDIDKAIPASAAFLAELKGKYGNLGLAAAAYNAGETRVSRWLSDGGFLPLETENYVLDILGEPADSFTDRAYSGAIKPLDDETSFAEACRKLPAADVTTVAMASVFTKPWGIQVAGHFRRNVAIRQWQRMSAKHAAFLADQEPVISRVRSRHGRRGIYAVRIGADSLGDANRICGSLRSAGAACIVLRNR